MIDKEWMKLFTIELTENQIECTIIERVSKSTINYYLIWLYTFTIVNVNS